MSEKMALFEEHVADDLSLPQVSAPSKQLLEGNIKKTIGVTQTVRDVRQGFNPDHEHKLVIPTRFSSKPPPANTFFNFQPSGPSSASYMSEKARVTSLTGNRFLNTNVEFQKEDKNKKLNLQQARAENKRANVEQLNHKIF